ncbi:unnamed protein product [Calypogeia fissa]
MRSALNCLLVVFLFAASLVPLGDATAEGDALFTMMQKWSVQFPGWVAGGNPCSPLWKYVQCMNGSVVELNVTNTGISGTIPSIQRNASNIFWDMEQNLNCEDIA